MLRFKVILKDLQDLYDLMVTDADYMHDVISDLKAETMQYKEEFQKFKNSQQQENDLSSERQRIKLNILTKVKAQDFTDENIEGELYQLSHDCLHHHHHHHHHHNLSQ